MSDRLLYLCLVVFIIGLMFNFLNAVSIQQIEAQQGPPKPCSPNDEDAYVSRGRMIDQSTNNNDRIIGTNNADPILGKGGNDCLMGKSGNDIIKGGMGIDILIGGEGVDRLDGGERDLSVDIIYCDQGDIVSNSARDELHYCTHVDG